MMRLLMIAALALTALFGLVIGGLRLQPRENPAEADMVGCTMPCWKGIAPGSTSSDDALAVLNSSIGSAPFGDACFFPLSDACVRYTWTSPDGTIPYAEMAIEQRQIEALIIYAPRFTLGDALLTLHSQRVGMDGAFPGFASNQQFYAQVFFANSRLILRASAPCPGTYLDLMETPIRAVEVDSPRLDVPMSAMTSFAAMRQAFAQACS